MPVHNQPGPDALGAAGTPDRDPGTTGAGGADNVVVIGAGPAGLTAAYELGRVGRACTVLEADDVVGGISRTVERDGWRFDIGGHRFFTKVKAVEDFWHEVLPGEELMVRPRLSRIYYQGKYYDYPLKPFNALRNLGLVESLRCAASYAWARVRPPKDQTTFEGWVAARFGWRLYRHFFKTYTEKVWGYPGSELQADWAAQRIKNLNLFNAVKSALFPEKGQRRITTLIDQFEYPRLGPGMMWEHCRDKVEASGSKVMMSAEVTRITREDGRAVSVTSVAEGAETEHRASAVISSMPLSALVKALDPPAPPHIAAAAADLHYRDHVTVALVVPESVSFPDNWVYVHDPAVKMGRIQNFGRWSPYMVKDGRACLGLEYFVFEGDEIWSMADEDLVEMGKQEISRLGLVDPSMVEAGYIVRMPKAYPYYDADYKRNVELVRSWLDDNVPNVHPVGRNGMHRYNNQDHSMYTAMLTVQNLLGASHDVWSVNVEEEYHEEMSTVADRSVVAAKGDGSGRAAPILPKRARPGVQ